MYKIGGIFIGLLLSIMITFNAILSRYSGVYPSTFLINLTGLLIVLVILLFYKERNETAEKAPFYLYFGGAIGVALVSFNSISFDALGVSLTVSLGILGQYIMSAIVDHYGLLGMKKDSFNKAKLPGFLMIFAGIIVMIIF